MAEQQGFIQIIIILALVVVILSLLGVSLSSLFGNPLLKNNFSFLWDWLVTLWNNVLSVPFTAIWHVWVNFIWQPFLEVVKKFEQGVNPFN